MTEKLFENIINNLGKKKEPTLEEQSQKQLEKYLTRPKSYNPMAKQIVDNSHKKLSVSQIHKINSETRPKKFDWDKQQQHTIDTLNKFENANIPNPKAVTFDPTTQIFTNEDRTVAFKSYDDADKHNRSIGVKKGPTYSGATPEQFGKLAERLERNRQQQGNPTRVGEFEKAFNKVKKPIKKYTPIKIDIPFVSLPDPIAVRRDPQQELRTQRFNRMVEDSERKRLREQSSGLASFLGKKFI